MEMIDISYRIEFFSYWQCGSGLASGADVDSVAKKDSKGFPFVPGKTIKGLLREAMILLGENEMDDNFQVLFGISDDTQENGAYIKNCAFFQNAELPQKEKDKIEKNGLQLYLYKRISSTALNSNGITEEGSLRTMEVVIPLKLEGKIVGVGKDYVPTVERGLKLIKRLGTNRNRGYGTCSFSIYNMTKQVSTESSLHSTSKFKCKLLTDVILTRKGRTEGVRETLDYIPGNVFLGLIARKYTTFTKPNDVFHSNKVRFSDAHLANDYKNKLKFNRRIFKSQLFKSKSEIFKPPLVFDKETYHSLYGKVRSYKVPLVMCHQKGESKPWYLHHLITDFAELNQLKQCRNGFYDFSQRGYAIELKANKILSLKSAYDFVKRKSKDEQMYCYESLEKGKSFLFDIDIDESVSTDDRNKILNGIIGQHRIGSSHSAEFGLVEITRYDFKEINVNEVKPNGKNEIYIYADSRLIFLDDFGVPTCDITAKYFGVEGEIDWNRSQIRTFQYAPWNGKRGVRDADRWGFEKGSVFVITGCNDSLICRKYVGSYQNEGFGRIIMNPPFLFSDGENGKSEYQPIVEKRPSRRVKKKYFSEIETNESFDIIRFLNNKKERIHIQNDILKAVNQFKEDNSFYYKGISSSQWGEIRSIATFGSDDRVIKNDIKSYLTKGVASEKWVGKPCDLIVSFMAEKANLRSLMINLASVMGKKIEKYGDK